MLIYQFPDAAEIALRQSVVPRQLYETAKGTERPWGTLYIRQLVQHKWLK